MGQGATIFAIDQPTYEAAVGGRAEDIVTVESITPLDLDKSWHAIHFILTGSSENTFLQTGYQLDVVDEHCEVHSPESVRSLSLKLKGADARSILETVDFDAPETVALYVWGPREEFYDYLFEHLSKFLDFIRRADEKGFGILVTIC